MRISNGIIENSFFNRFSIKKTAVRNISLLFLLLSSLMAVGQSIYTNPITGTNPNTANPYTTGQTVNANITVSGIGRGTGINGTNANNRYNANAWSSGTLDANDYFYFTITPNSSYEIDFVSFVYTGQSSMNGPTSFALRSSLDGYSANIGSPIANGATISLSASQFQNISSTITFRLYGFGAVDAGGTFSVNDFTFNGNVCIPLSGLTYTSTSINTCVNATIPDNTVSAITGSTPTNFSISPALPSGLSISSSTGTISGTPLVSSPTTSYTITATNACGTTTQTVSITVNALPTATISGNTSFCNGSNTTLTASGGTSYMWSTGANIAPVTVNMFSTYVVTVTDANGCTDTESVTTTLSSTANNGTSGIFESYVVIGSQYYDLQNATGNPDFQGANLGSYTTSGNLNFSGGEIKTYKNSGDNICGGKVWYSIYPAAGSPGSFTSVNLPFNFDMANPGDQQWGTSGNISNILASLPAGNYKIAVYVDASGNQNGASACSCDPFKVQNNSNNYWIANFTVCADPVCPSSFSTCLNNTPINLSGASPAGGAYSGPGVSSGIFNPSTAGVGAHTITYTYDDGNGCVTNCTFSITVNALPTPSASNDSPKCTGSSINLSSSGGSTYSWTGPNMFTSSDQNPAITNATITDAGIYTVLVTDGNGCIDIATTNVIILDLPTGVVSGGGSVCPGNTLPDVTFTFTGTPPFDFTYSDGSNTFNASSPTTTYTLTAAPVGTYTLTALSDDDCTAVMAGLTGSATNAYNAVPVLNTPAVIARCSGVAWGVNLPSAASGVINAYRAESRTYNPLTMTFSSQIPNVFPAPGLGTPITVPEVWYNTTSNPGTVTYAISATTDGLCYGPAVDMTVTINPLPTAVIAVAETSGTTNDDGIICNGASATLTASGGTSYQWDNMTTNAMRTVSPASTTSYFVTVTDGNGCTDTETTTINVNNLPMVNAGSYGPLCVSSTTQALSGSPMGGSFSGAGVSGNNFNASMAGASTHTITYGYTDVNGCSNSATTNIIVNALPMVNAGTYPAQCVSATTLALAGSPMGGTFSGPGVTGNNFNASVAGTGTKTITYTYTDGNGCTNSATSNITVNALPVVNAGTYPDQCFTNTMLTLTGSPIGGTFSGTGVSGNNFDASAAGVGMHTITYNYTDGNGCTNSATTSITVNALPVVDAGSYPAQCVNATMLTLSGSPMGGTFSGPGVSGNNFNAALAGTGMHTITYNFTNGSGCSNSATTSITVNGLPMVNAGSYTAQCVSENTLALVGSPMGGTFSGAGVSGNNFNASTAGSGTHTITYSYTDGNGCTNTSTTNITVNALPIASINSSSDCGGANTTLMASGGTSYSWSTMENTQSIIVTTSGIFTVTVTDGNGCTDTESVTVNPATPPIYNQSTMTCYSDISMAINNLMPGETLVINIGSYTGQIEIPLGATLIISPNTSVTATGTSCILGSVQVDPMGSFTNTGTLSGNGNVTGKMVNNGTLSPGVCTF
ncbi:MAG: putative Ig domain-containing protein [Saprospiraceae bacterium]|nr:putative Ig domain-containing protein [Saprospiraceae bacterium]